MLVFLLHRKAVQRGAERILFAVEALDVHEDVVLLFEQRIFHLLKIGGAVVDIGADAVLGEFVGQVDRGPFVTRTDADIEAVHVLVALFDRRHHDLGDRLTFFAAAEAVFLQELLTNGTSGEHLQHVFGVVGADVLGLLRVIVEYHLRLVAFRRIDRFDIYDRQNDDQDDHEDGDQSSKMIAEYRLKQSAQLFQLLKPLQFFFRKCVHKTNAYGIDIENAASHCHLINISCKIHDFKHGMGKNRFDRAMCRRQRQLARKKSGNLGLRDRGKADAEKQGKGSREQASRDFQLNLHHRRYRRCGHAGYRGFSAMSR